MAGEDEILYPIFHERAKIDLDRAKRALETEDAVGWHTLLDTFTAVVRSNQLMIV